VVYSPYPLHDKKAFFKSLREFFRAEPHEVLHCHHDFMSALYLWASTGLPFRKRIVHIHNCEEEIPTPNRLKAILLKEPMRQTCIHMADHIVGVSQYSLSQFLRNIPPRSGRDLVLSCGIETNKFKSNDVWLRRQLEISDNAKVILFVGRMVPLKNPAFVLEVLKVLAATDQSIVACFVGTGALAGELERIAVKHSLLRQVRFLGWRDDVAEIMKASDLLLFPNLEYCKEALGLALVEAQAAGLPMLLSLGALEEAVVIPELATFLPLSAGPEAWAQRAREILSQSRPVRKECLARIERSSFSIENSARKLMELYQS
jgi:glycosyltransferase involved in cell wall biosynthesis